MMTAIPAHALDDMDRGTPTVTATGYIEWHRTSGSKPLRMDGDDGHQYWVKPMDNPHYNESLLAERVVATVGSILHAPLVESVLIDIPEELVAGERYADDMRLITPGVAHGSRILPNALESDHADHVTKDHNSQRYPHFIALWLLCAGEDEQWLFDAAADKSVYTFDHGVWLGGQDQWTLRSLLQAPAYDAGWPFSVAGMDSQSFLAAASAIEGFSAIHALRAVASVPVAWGFADVELVGLANWLLARREPAAQKLRGLANRCTR